MPKKTAPEAEVSKGMVVCIKDTYQSGTQLEKGKTKQAVIAVETFIREVEALERGGVLSAEAAAELIMQAENIIQAIEIES